MVQFQVQLLPGGYMPERKSAEAAGWDLRAAKDFCVPKGERVLVPCAIKIALPKGYEGQIRSRSGLALNDGIMVLNSPGTLDSDYRGEIGVLLMNHGGNDYYGVAGERIAQLVISAVEPSICFEVTELPKSSRGESGWGSTGKK